MLEITFLTYCVYCPGRSVDRHQILTHERVTLIYKIESEMWGPFPKNLAAQNIKIWAQLRAINSLLSSARNIILSNGKGRCKLQSLLRTQT